jgi:hypothetical protein
MVTNWNDRGLYFRVQNKLFPGGFKMKRHIALRRVGWLLGACVTMAFFTAKSQITHVQINLPSFDYDVIYLADFIDVSSNKLAKDIPNFSGTITADGNGKIILEITAQLELKGDPGPSPLVTAITKPFTVNGTRTITANDLAGGISDIDIKTWDENKSTRKRLEDYTATFPTAPVGEYILDLKAWDVTASGTQGTTLLGSVHKVITVRNASPEEVQVNLVDPQPGATIATTFPTFSWNSPNPKVTLYVYEKLPIYQSLQEAITGVPYLKQDLEGPQTFTYPANALRRLQQNKSYAWFVEASVVTNRQTVVRRSEVRLFRIRLNDRQSQEISDMMNSFGGSAGGTFATLQSMGWTPTGTMTLDGKPITLEELKAVVAKLVAQNALVTLRIE